MNLSLKKYFSFNYFSMLTPLFRDGVYRQDTYDEKDNPIITTRFYLDGDVQNELYELDEGLLVEMHEEKVNEHMQKLEKNVLSMDAFYAQIQVMVVLLTSMATFLLTMKTNNYGLLENVGITAAIGTVVFLLKKYWFKALVWIFQKFIVPMIIS